MKIAWVSSDIRPDIASFRYRGLYPSFYLLDNGFESSYFAIADIRVDVLKEYDVIVFIKTIGQFLTPIMRELSSRYNRKVILDLCDYATHPKYGNNTGELRRFTVLSQAQYLSAITVPTEQLKIALSSSLGDAIPIVVIPDQEETEELIERTRVLNSAKARREIFLRRLLRPRSLLLVCLSWARRIYIRWRKQAKGRLSRVRQITGEMVRNPKIFVEKARQKIGRRSVFASQRQFSAGDHPTRGADAQKPQSIRRKQLIWFGNAGSDSFQSGIQTLTLIAPELIKLAREVDFELLVMSSRPDAYKALIEPLPFRSRFESWTQQKCFEAVRASDAFVMPQIEDAFSACKSANRALLALSCGTPVIASNLKSLDPLKSCIVIDDWKKGFDRYLCDESATKADLEKARSILDLQFSARATGQKWMDLIHSERVQSPRTPRITVLFHLLQDIHVLQPIVDLLWDADGARADDLDYELDVAVLKSVYLQQPSIVQDIVNTGARLRLLTGDTDEENLELLDVAGSSLLIVGAETSLRPHKFVHAAALEAGRLRIPTITLQHGLEAPGLTYFDDRHSTDVKIASSTIFTYGDIAKLPVGPSPEILPRCIPVGRFIPQRSAYADAFADQLAEINSEGLPVISIFENLHWHRYQADGYRDRFTAYIDQLTAAFGDAFFVIKPHPAGTWLQTNADLISQRKNTLLLRRDRVEFSEVTAADLISASQAVITTPSTVAVDAAQLSRPVIVFGNTLELPLFDPLEIARSYEDLRSFVQRALTGNANIGALDAFKSGVFAHGSVAENTRREIQRLISKQYI
ncbi:hypothetical protein DTW90_35680 [Neorhizobium sp. P12A]|uniref:glycosyltransferase n=1 Tax=Neorhizobium sp. P12A TaxID=2268027 RepID=UPI0011EFF2D5|nr:glycosyltransferase [Neorhizobium sp. P12A]KAA0685041.1 hypothetical protein DTW90_35680 [Neorhizobium sp. P12A]